MKRFLTNFLITSFCMVATFAAQAQDWSLGVKGGVNISKLQVANGVKTSSLVGFHLGGFASTNITDQIGVQPEVQISFQGYENNVKDNINLVYLQIPLMIKYYLIDQFNVQAGPQLGFLVGATDNREDFLKSTDLGISAGAEYQVVDAIGVGARYTLGLPSVLDSPESDIKWRNRLFQIFVTYKLNN